MRKEIWQRGCRAIEYRSGDEFCGCDVPWGSGPTIHVKCPTRGGSYEHWHTTRLWGRNRTTTECVSLALAWITEREMGERRAEQEAEIATEEANALAEFANDIAGELPA